TPVPPGVNLNALGFREAKGHTSKQGRPISNQRSGEAERLRSRMWYFRRFCRRNRWFRFDHLTSKSSPRYSLARIRGDECRRAWIGREGNHAIIEQTTAQSAAAT